jgi:exodeoxyribonuclease VII large subunit
MYFTLKDDNASLRCVVWRPEVARLKFSPRDGMLVQADGSVSVYEVAGQYQLYITEIRPAGEGALYQEFLRSKERLEAEGLFDAARKRPIPVYPSVIGIVTSPTGAAIKDILNTLGRRYPLANVVIAPTPVQGIDSPPGIVQAIEKLNRIVHPDVILLARGGGSIEDLWGFNDEAVARAISRSETPIITGVGHETDFTIADFASDLRAPTPTAAAELATPNRLDLASELAEYERRLDDSVSNLLQILRNAFAQAQSNLVVRSPQKMVLTYRQRLDEMLHLCDISIAHLLNLKYSRLESLEKRLSSLSPDAVLKRGYAVINRKSGGLVTSARQASSGDEISIQMHDGDFPAVVTNNQRGKP